MPRRVVVSVHLSILFAGTYATARAQAPTVAGELAISAAISSQLYCRADKDVGFLELEVKFSFQNVSNGVVFLHKGIGADHYVLVAKDAESMTRRDYENQFSFTSFAAESQEHSFVSIRSLLARLGKKESFAKSFVVRLPFQMAPNVNVGMKIGNHVTEIVFPGWPDSSHSPAAVQVELKSSARLFKTAVRSPILAISIPERITLDSCP